MDDRELLENLRQLERSRTVLRAGSIEPSRYVRSIPVIDLTGDTNLLGLPSGSSNSQAKPKPRPRVGEAEVIAQRLIERQNRERRTAQRQAREERLRLRIQRAQQREAAEEERRQREAAAKRRREVPSRTSS